MDHPPHAWFPSSSCTTDCVTADETIGALGSGVRIAGLVGTVGVFPWVQVVTPRRWRPKLQRTFARGVLRLCGIELRVRDERPFRGTPRTGSLVVAAHTSWVDVLALAAVNPLGFVARADLLDWPVLGFLTRRLPVVPLDRRHLRELPEVVEQVAGRLEAGRTIGIFPEGTTWCGRAHGRLRPALLQAAIDARAPIQPVRLRYLNRHGHTCTTAAFVGDDDMLSSLWRLVRNRAIVVEIVLLPPLSPHSDRRTLARALDHMLWPHRLRTRSREHPQSGLSASHPGPAALPSAS